MTQQRCVVVGDAHGCFDELMDLMEKCAVTDDDWVISLGDVTDRGPKIREVVEFFMARDRPNARSMILGNHEERHLRYFVEWQRLGAPTNPGIIASAVHFKADYHKDSFLSLGPQHYEWFKTLPKFMRLPEYTDRTGALPITLIHAGCVPDVPLERQDDFLLMHISDVMPPEPGARNDRGRLLHGYWTGHEQSWWTSKSPEGAKYWASIYDGSLGHVIFGHTGFPQVAQFPFATGIDTGCCFGRELTALILPEWRFVSVPARATYKSRRDCARFEVYPGIEVYS